MTKTFTYNVCGVEFKDTIAFGKAWNDAKILATKNHCGITRTVAKDNTVIANEFYSNGGCFLNEKYYEPKKLRNF